MTLNSLLSEIARNRDLYSVFLDDAFSSIEASLGTKFDDVKEFHLGKAIEQSSEAIEIIKNKYNSDLALAHILRSAAFFNLNKYNETIDDLKRAIELEPQTPTAYALLGDTMNHLDNKNEAKTNYKRALKLVETTPIEKRTGDDYSAAIATQIGLKSLGFSVQTDYALEALKRGILTQKQIDTIK